jgi:hypothetical protein
VIQSFNVWHVLASVPLTATAVADRIMPPADQYLVQ